MATFPLKPLIYYFLFGFIIFTYNIQTKATNPPKFSTTLNTIRLNQEKLSHFHFYWHDKLGGRDPTAVQVATSTINISPATRFGDVYVVDDPLTEGPTAESKMVGRAQGLYTYSSKEEVGLLMAMNFVFMVGEYSGSTITILGRNIVMSKEREMAVVGGSGLFRFARGYAKLKTYSLSVTTAIVEFILNVYNWANTTNAKNNSDME
ncbi:hypothetical protein Scep_013847 [Stephania cephalantha]|uniref:Dirigent protein n=1 Tax=Stephania cephalantha TaxID=152367 RepID=A0AAP0J055_9MAGN